MNPSAEPFDCVCGKATKVNTRTGRLYSHTLPDSARTCPRGGDLVRAPEDGAVFILPDTPQPTPPPPSDRRPRGDERSVSIRSISGGLPELGKRR